MAPPRLFWLLSGTGLCMLLCTNYSLFAARKVNPTAQAPREAPALSEGLTTPLQPARNPASVSAVGRQQRELSSGVSVGAPSRRATDVAQSAAHGSLPPRCVRPEPDADRRKLLRFVPARTSPAADADGAPASCSTPLCAALGHALRSVPRHSLPNVLMTSAVRGQEAMLATFAEAAAALRVPLVVIAMDEAAFAAAKASTAASVLARAGDGAGGDSTLARKWAAIAEALEAGVGLMWADVDAVVASQPFDSLHADADFEGLSEGWEESFTRGYVMGSDDPSMGWSRYCETMRAALLAPSLFYLLPTTPSLALARRMSRAAGEWRAAPGAAWGGGTEESIALSTELLTPAHDGSTRVGASVRVLSTECWLHERVALSRLVPKAGGRAFGQRPAALLPGRGVSGGGARQREAFEHYHRGNGLGGDGSSWVAAHQPLLPAVWTLERTRVDPLMGHERVFNRTKALVLGSRCRRLVEPGREGSDSRPLNLLAPARGEWPINCKGFEQMCEVVRRVHKERAVMAAVSNRNILHMLGEFVDVVKRVGVTNFMVVALDQSTSEFLVKKQAAHYVRALRSRSGSTDNHATSGLKFQILSELLSVGVSVLLSDVDVVLTQDPFPALYRDSDVEGMSDGWDDDSAYGHVHELPLGERAPASGPLRSVRMVARNSGLFFLSATHESLRLMKVLAKRMASEDVWDQSAYNMEIFRAAYGPLAAVGASVRTMNYLCFCNTKLLFKYMRHDAQLIDPSRHVPVSVHINYHPEKEARMVSVSAFYHHNDAHALDAWNGGEGRRTDSCRGKVGVASSSMVRLGKGEAQKHTLIRNLLKADEAWAWSGRGPVRFEPDGSLTSPWGRGSWGSVPSPWRKDAVHVQLGGATYLLMFLSEKWAFVALRCSDEQVTYGRLQRADVPEKRLVF